MNILYLVPYTPTLIRTRPYNLIRGLVRRGHRVTLATLWEDEAERRALDDWRSQGVQVIAMPLSQPRKAWNTLRGLLLPWDARPGEANDAPPMPLQAYYCWQLTLARAASFQLPASSFDLIHVEHLRGAHYGLFLKSQLPATSFQPPASSFQPPIIWDSVDCISYLFEQAARQSRSAFGRLMARLELGRTRRYEGWLVGQFDRVLVTSEVDRSELEKLADRYGVKSQASDVKRQTSISVLPNGVDLGYFCPDDTPRDDATVIFTGKMSYHANVTAALYLVNDIMPLVWRERPEVRVVIAGKDPPRVLQNLIPPDARRMTHDVRRMTHDASRLTPNASRITITGAVPDLRPYLHRATVAAVPILYGAGIQNKVLEAMACGTPVVASPQAVAALQARDGEDLLVAGAAETFARHILHVLDDPALARRLSAAGRRYVETHHDWNRIAGELEAIYADALRGRQA